MTLTENRWPAEGPPGAAEAWAKWEPTVHEDDVDHDFDASWAERGIKPTRVRILGDVYQLPAEPPAKLILLKARMRNGDRNREVEQTEVVEMLATMIGRLNVDRLLDKGIGPTQLLDVMQYCMRHMGQNRGEADAPKAGATASTGSSSSSGTGGFSAPTGDASTTPTS